MRKAFGIFILSVLLLAAALGGCNRQGGSAADDFPTLTPVPPTATPAPPTATPVPPTATPIPPTPAPVTPATPAPTHAAFDIKNYKTWNLKVYPHKGPEPQTTDINWGTTNYTAFYIGNPDVRTFFILRAKEYFEMTFGHGRGKAWIVDDNVLQAFEREFIIPHSPKEKGLLDARKKFRQMGVYLEYQHDPLSDPAYALVWDVWLVVSSDHTFPPTVIVRWVQAPQKADVYYLSNDQLERSNDVDKPVEYFILWRLDKDGKWKVWKGDAKWLLHAAPRSVVAPPN